MARSVTLIPAKSRVTTENKKTGRLRMAAYCRVSSDAEDQLHSYKAQKSYYRKYINEHDEYEMADIYADEGITGTNTRKRDDFKRLINDCREGKVDIVITKSISRFARNTRDSLTYMRELKGLGIPIIFEKENINTMDAGSELLFTILSSLAQDESRNISENCKWGIRNKYRDGQFSMATNTFIGYDRGPDGKLVINEEQAKAVRRIFREFLEGRNPAEIAAGLMKDKIPGSRGVVKWSSSTVQGVLRNEKHMGDVLLQKTYTADFLTKKIVKNTGEVPQVYIEDDHEAIIDKETWQAVQEELKRRQEFMKKHGISRYSQGSAPNPFMSKIFCGECGMPYTKHTWSDRGISQWQCRGHRVKGILRCKNAFVDVADLERAFVTAFNKLMSDDNRKKEWENAIQSDSALERIRARQLLELAKQPPLTGMVNELGQLVVHEITILGAKKYAFTFMDGTKITVNA